MITAQQLRMAKAALNWSFEEWAEETGLSLQGLRNLHNGVNKPQETTIEKIIPVFEAHGIEFIDGGVRQKQKIVEVYEGKSCYLRVLDEIIIEKPQEVMFSGADESRSTPESIKRLGEIRRAGIGFRNLIKNGDTYIMGALNEYRWMPDELFVDGDVKVIYGDTVVYFASWLEVPRAIKITDKNIAEENIRMFNHLWDIGQIPQETTSDTFYD
jgi:transcriptional regulator with XRE-family HTH domain